MWKTINADAMESDPGEDSPDNKKMHALYLRKCGKKHAIENMVKELKEDYKKYKDDPDTEYYVRKALVELLLIQVLPCKLNQFAQMIRRKFEMMKMEILMMSVPYLTKKLIITYAKTLKW
ncbi:hypothetical protein L195_g014429 [Trifolium pratense]|uniref:Uncharacterized protein n=1 Tax=Trifolium pratense TaxID=57577 RepID=A0A2K3PQY3_TRIPR|nr:hypothetical protein L195_g014429 [Trifolium pratense]